MSITYTIREGQLNVSDGARTLWEGGFEGVPVVQIVQISDSDRCLVLLDPGAKQATFENLLMVSPTGSIVWKAELPQSHDAFSKIITNSNSIEATTWNGLRVKLDPATGRVTESRFVK
jgi:hypothetical protein